MIGCTGNSDKASNDSEIRIGQFGSLTGAEATFGQSTDKGIRLAIDAVNAAGGVKGKKIKLNQLVNISLKLIHMKVLTKNLW